MSILRRAGMVNCNPSLTRELSRQQYKGKLHLKSVPTKPNKYGFLHLYF